VGPALRARPWLPCTALYQAQQVIQLGRRSPRSDEIVARRVEFLTGYQDAAYAAAATPRFVERVRAAEAPLGAGSPAWPRRWRATSSSCMAIQGRVRGGAAAHRSRLHARASTPMFEGDYRIGATWRRR
jgi:hypothetical protein